MRHHWIDGRRADGRRSAIAVADPATGELVGSVARGTPEDADRAVRAARAAFAELALRPRSREGGDCSTRSPGECASVTTSSRRP